MEMSNNLIVSTINHEMLYHWYLWFHWNERPLFRQKISTGNNAQNGFNLESYTSKLNLFEN